MLEVSHPVSSAANELLASFGVVYKRFMGLRVSVGFEEEGSLCLGPLLLKLLQLQPLLVLLRLELLVRFHYLLV